jgi:hypothetical protein
VYATYAHVNNGGLPGAIAVGLNGAVTTSGGSSSGFDIGIRHSF